MLYLCQDLFYTQFTVRKTIDKLIKQDKSIYLKINKKNKETYDEMKNLFSDYPSHDLLRTY